MKEKPEFILESTRLENQKQFKPITAFLTSIKCDYFFCDEPAIVLKGKMDGLHLEKLIEIAYENKMQLIYDGFILIHNC